MHAHQLLLEWDKHISSQVTTEHINMYIPKCNELICFRLWQGEGIRKLIQEQENHQINCSFQQTYHLEPCFWNISEQQFQAAKTKQFRQHSIETEPDRKNNEQQMLCSHWDLRIWISRIQSFECIFKKAYCWVLVTSVRISLNTKLVNYLAVRNQLSSEEREKVRNKHIAFLSCYLYFDLWLCTLKLDSCQENFRDFWNLGICGGRREEYSKSKQEASFFFFFSLKMFKCNLERESI